MSDVFKGKVIVVTGASSGMGAATARKLAGEGGTLVLAARRKDRIDALAAEIKRSGAEALAVATDVARYEQVKALVDAAIARFGRVDIMVNNAGFGVVKSFVDSTIEEIDRQIDVNLKGVSYGCYAVLPQMLKQRSGHIVNIGSICSVRTYPNFAAYTAAKFGLLGLSRCIYEEVREKGIRVNTICPAAANTEWMKVAGMGASPWKLDDLLQPQDVAELVFACVTLPPRVQVENVIAWSTCQATA